MFYARPKIADSLAISTVVVVVAGGVFFGLYSCGGYAWHKQAFVFLALLLSFLSVFVPGLLLKSWARRGTFLALVLLVYVFAESMTAPFYPAMPGSLSEYWSGVVRALEDGPC